MRLLSGVWTRLGRSRTWLRSVVSGEGAADADGAAPRGELEEEILFVLRQRGGSARRQAVVEETRWQAGAVGDCLTRMAATGRVERVRRDGEDVVVLPGREPTEQDEG